MSTKEDFRWGYESTNGPHVWGKYCSKCNGSKQSPIDIKTTEVQSFKANDQLEYYYKPLHGKRAELVNVEHYWMIKVHYPLCLCGPHIKGVPPIIKDSYLLFNMHMHWGIDDFAGSEHTINGERFACEMHYLHWNATKFTALDEAVLGPPGSLCGLAILFELGRPNEELNKIISHFNRIEYAEEKTQFTCSINPQAFIPKNPNYYYYPGALTVPKCHECIQWIIYKEKLTVSRQQISSFRKLRSIKRGGKLPEGSEFKGYQLSNVRPCLPLGGRVVVEHIFDS